MGSPVSLSFFDRLKRRKLIQWALAYMAVGWAVLQVLDLIGDRFGWPDVVLRILIVLIAAGLLLTLVLAWYHGEHGEQRVRGAELLLVGVVVAVAGAGVLLVRRGSGPPVPAREIIGVPAERGSIAVLPFVNMSGEADQEYFSDGMTEELISALSRVEGLRVAARTSAFQFKGRGADVREVGERLGVATVLEGSVRKSNDRLRITVQLIDASNGYHLWTETYEQQLSDVFAVQDEISRRIVAVLRARLSPELGNAMARASTHDVEAFELYLRGRYFASRRSEEGLTRAAEFFQQAIAVDSTYARAWAGLADSWISPRRLPPAERFRKGEVAALKALELDSTLAEAHVSLGWIRMWQDRDWAAAERHFERAIRSDPAYLWAHQWYGAYLDAVGRLEDGLVAIGRAHALDPLSLTTMTHVGTHYLWLRRYDEAVAAYREALEVDPEFGQARSGLGRAWLFLGRHREAVAELRRGDDYASHQQPALLAHALALAGEEAEARALLRDLVDGAAAGRVPAVNPAIVYIALGEHAQALRWLERVPDDRGALFFAADPIYDPVRADPRFRDLLHALRLDGTPAARLAQRASAGPR